VTKKFCEDEAADCAKDLALLLLVGSCRYALLDEVEAAIRNGATALFKDAATLALSVRRDHLSSRMMIIMEIPADIEEDPDVQWAEMGDQPTDKIIGYYSLGLLSEDGHGTKKILLRPKVVTAALIRFISTPSK
jgi:hypothetical protein